MYPPALRRLHDRASFYILWPKTTNQVVLTQGTRENECIGKPNLGTKASSQAANETTTVDPIVREAGSTEGGASSDPYTATMADTRVSEPPGQKQARSDFEHAGQHDQRHLCLPVQLRRVED